LLVRFRHPAKAAIKSVLVNGKSWSAYDPDKEWIIIENPEAAAYRVEATY
jgi:hypothetical protein